MPRSRATDLPARSGWPRLDDAVVAIAEQFNRAQVEMLGSVLCDPARAMPVADDAGVHQHLFGEEDLRLVYLACHLSRGATPIEALKLARRALREAGFWHPRGPIYFGTRWSNETLAMLAESYPFCGAAVRLNAERLIAVEARVRLAGKSLAEAWRYLTDREATALPAPAPRTATAPVPRMTAADAREAVVTLAKLFPGQITDGLGRFLAEQLRPFTLARVKGVINAYRASHESLNLVEFIECCRVAERAAERAADRDACPAAGAPLRVMMLPPARGRGVA